MVLVGAFARIDPTGGGEVRSRLSALSGVEVFDLDDPGKVGLLIEAADTGLAHRVLTSRVRNVEGVWGVWPVYVHGEGDPREETGRMGGPLDR